MLNKGVLLRWVRLWLRCENIARRCAAREALAPAGLIVGEILQEIGPGLTEKYRDYEIIDGHDFFGYAGL